MGTWIEIGKRGDVTVTTQVVPFVGTWIEMAIAYLKGMHDAVVPFVGTWIEILFYMKARKHQWSYPSWVRGLKFRMRIGLISLLRRTLRGYVD